MLGGLGPTHRKMISRQAEGLPAAAHRPSGPTARRHRQNCTSSDARKQQTRRPSRPRPKPRPHPRRPDSHLQMRAPLLARPLSSPSKRWENCMAKLFDTHTHMATGRITCHATRNPAPRPPTNTPPFERGEAPNGARASLFRGGQAAPGTGDTPPPSLLGWRLARRCRAPLGQHTSILHTA
jgi:hypothetical protein